MFACSHTRRENLIYYASRQMSPVEREAMAVVYACKKIWCYKLGYRIVFHTAYDSLKYLVNKSDLFGQIARWILLHQEFNYEVVVKLGNANSNVDNMSCQ